MQSKNCAWWMCVWMVVPALLAGRWAYSNCCHLRQTANHCGKMAVANGNNLNRPLCDVLHVARGSKLDFITDNTNCASTQAPKLIGHGLEKRKDGVYALMAGVLHETESKIWLNTSTKRYIPHSGERVLGTVTSKIGDYFKVDIGAADLALLNFTSFEGATKRNRPDVKVGDLIYGQVILTSRQLEPELSCVDAEGRSRGMGMISAPGLVFSVSLNYSRRLLSTDDKLLIALSKELKFEITIGMNGKIWVSGELSVVLPVRNAILEGETTFDSNIPLLVKNATQKAGLTQKNVVVSKDQNDLKAETSMEIG